MTTNLQQNAANVLETTRRVFVKARIVFDPYDPTELK